jgi:hypothetical protein
VKNVINKYRLLTTVFGLAVLLSVTMFAVGCGSGRVSNRLEVSLKLPDPGSVKFDQFDTVLFRGVELEGIPENFDPGPFLDSFFIDDISRTTEKKVEPWEREKHGEMVPKKLLESSGKLKLEIKSRSKIRDVKVGNKTKRKFVTVQHWTMTLTVILTDASAGKVLYKDDFNAKLANADAETVKFNFDNLFFKVSSRFLKRITRTKKMQRRHLLL